jgi:hypothetical protein
MAELRRLLLLHIADLDSAEPSPETRDIPIYSFSAPRDPSGVTGHEPTDAVQQSRL